MVLMWGSPLPSTGAASVMLFLLCYWPFAGAFRHERHLREKWSAERKLTASQRQVEEQAAQILGGFALTRGLEAVVSTQ